MVRGHAPPWCGPPRDPAPAPSSAIRSRRPPSVPAACSRTRRGCEGGRDGDADAGGERIRHGWRGTVRAGVLGGASRGLHVCRPVVLVSQSFWRRSRRPLGFEHGRSPIALALFASLASMPPHPPAPRTPAPHVDVAALLFNLWQWVKNTCSASTRVFTFWHLYCAKGISHHIRSYYLPLSTHTSPLPVRHGARSTPSSPPPQDVAKE